MCWFLSSPGSSPLSWPQFRFCQGQQSRWFCRHSASNRLFAKHDVSLFPVARAYLGHSIAFLALVFWILQLLTGFLLLGLLAWNLDVQYAELISIIFHGNFVWLVRMLHMLGANFVVISTIIHFAKAVAWSKVVSSSKLLLWIVGSALFLLSLGTAFTGYVVVSGNMSYWAALVILNLLTVLPILGEEVVGFVLGSATVTSWSLRRFTALHFVLAVVAVLLIAIHIVLLHRQSPSFSSIDIADGSSFLVEILAKDLAITLLIVGLITFDSVKTLVHPDNWNGFSRLLTPTHIEPEVYFLWTFSAIKLHNGKLAGAAFLVVLAFCSSQGSWWAPFSQYSC